MLAAVAEALVQLFAFPAQHWGIAQWRSLTVRFQKGPWLSEGVDEVQIGVHEACGVLELWVVADVLIQYGHCGSLDQFPKQRKQSCTDIQEVPWHNAGLGR